MMCIQHPSTIVACACIMTAWKWAGLEVGQFMEMWICNLSVSLQMFGHQIQTPEDGKEWFKRIDSNITVEKLQGNFHKSLPSIKQLFCNIRFSALSNELSASINTYQTKFFKKKSIKVSKWWLSLTSILRAIVN